jgi:hypothetical protein
MLTQQQVFDRTYDSLIKQGRTSANRGRCMYRGPFGCKCAIGHWIKDEHYHPSLENEAVDSDSVRDALFKSWPELEAHSCAFLADLQSAHDYTAGPDIAYDFIKWLNIRMARVASKYGLEFNPNANVRSQERSGE